MQLHTLKEGGVGYRLVHTGAGYNGGSFFIFPHVSANRDTSSPSFMEQKDTILTHTRWVAIFESFTQGTFDNRNGEAVIDFFLDGKLGDPDLSTGELPAQTPFKCPRFTADNFAPDSDDKIC